MNKFRYDVFLSHNSRDKAQARQLAERLRDQGLKVWFDEWVIKPGDDVYTVIEDALEASRTLVLCLSPASLGSGWVSLERTTILFRDPSRTDRHFIPLLLDDCEIPTSMRSFRFIDFRSRSESALNELSNACSPPVFSHVHDGGEAVTVSEPAQVLTSAKVVLLGDSGTGKTSLAQRLIGDRFSPTYSTHAMHVSRIDLSTTSGDSDGREVLLWDLAGQEDYRLTHQLFLDDAALALVVTSADRKDSFSSVNSWLKALDSATPPAQSRSIRRLLLLSKSDVTGVALEQGELERLCSEYGFVGCLRTSAKTGENCSDQANAGKPSKLKQLIAHNIPWDELPQTATPHVLAELKRAIIAMRENSDVLLLRFAELNQRLDQSLLGGISVGESDLRLALRLLGTRGIVWQLEFGDLVLLQPEVMNSYAGAIIRSARAHRDEIGCVLEADIYRPDFDFTGVDRLPRPDEELLLRAIVQTFLVHSLCIAEDTPNGRQLVFPSQYRREKAFSGEPDVFVSYTFSGEWQTIWSTLIVRLWYSKEFQHRKLWKNAAEFASSDGHLLGLKIESGGHDEASATVSLFFAPNIPDQIKVLFIEYVNRHLAKYAVEVTRDRRYVCARCGMGVTDLRAVRRRLAAGKDYIICQICEAHVNLVDFIEQQLKSDPVARKIAAMDEIATRQLDDEALKHLLVGHVQAITVEANQIFRLLTDRFGIDAEIEFKDDDGHQSGKKIYLQFNGAAFDLRTRQSDGKEVLYIKDRRRLDFWISQTIEVYLVFRQREGGTGASAIRWMNVTRELKNRGDKISDEIAIEGEALTMEALWKVRDRLFPRG